MKNKGLKVLGGITVILLAAFLLVTLTLDERVKSGIEEYGSELLQTIVTVESVSISPFSGNGTIKGFTVQNPENFSEEPALYIQEASMSIDIRSLFSDQIVIDEIIVKSPELFFEQKGIGVNLNTLNDNLHSYSGEPSEKTMVIDYLLMENGRVKVSTSIDRERTAEARLAQFELRDIGRDGNDTIQQSLRQVMGPLLQLAIEEAVKSGVTEQLENRVRDFLSN